MNDTEVEVIAVVGSHGLKRTSWLGEETEEQREALFRCP